MLTISVLEHENDLSNCFSSNQMAYFIDSYQVLMKIYENKPLLTQRSFTKGSFFLTFVK